jgi:large subunit ribosomal protein L25
MSAVLDAVRRETFGKNEAYRTRQTGKIPAVVYGGGDKGVAEPVSVDPKELSRILHSKSGLNSLISLKMGDADTQVLVKEYQIDPVTHKLIHADFFRVAMDKVIRVSVPVHLTGESKGVKLQGGTMDFVHREVEVECLPANIPEHITVDVSELALSQGVRVKDLPTDGNWKAVSEPENLIVHIVAPRAEAAATTADGAAPTAAAEPEVAKKGKTDKKEEK